MGTPEYAAVSLRRLLETPHRVRAVVTRPDKPSGRGHRTEPSAVKKLAAEAGIEVLDPASPRDEAFRSRLASLEVDLGVVVAYGRILPKAVLELPRLGCINAHGSLLPLLRGAAPIERAILAGFDKTGVTIMQMNEGLDEGDMLLSREIAIPPAMNGAELRGAMAALSADLLVQAVDALAAGPLQARPQSHADATFAPPLKKGEAALRWSEPARELWLRVRAFAPRPGAYAFDGSSRIKILEAQPIELDPGTTAGSVVRIATDGFVVACGHGALQVSAVQPEGKRAMPAADYARGARLQVGHRFDDGPAS
jgi:methionyl-tRNA formyltransferase